MKSRTAARTLLVTALLLVVSAGVLSSQQRELDDLTDSASYAIGMNYASQTLAPVLKKLRADGLPVNPELVAAAVVDMLTEGTPMLMPDSVAQMTLVEFQKLHVDAIAQAVLKEGEKFLSENRTREGIRETASGLQYFVVREGAGAAPGPTDSVQVRFRGFLVDSRVFEEKMDSVGSTVYMGDIIQGWIEGLQMMKEGGQMRLFIPPSLAFGSRSRGKLIRPNETLIYDIELISVIPTSDAMKTPEPSGR